MTGYPAVHYYHGGGEPSLMRKNIDPIEDAQKLRKAMKGMGTDEKTIIEILCKRTNAQRQEISVAYKESFNRDLTSDLKSELSGNFEHLLHALMDKPESYDVDQLHKAVKGLGTDDAALIEILCTRNNAELEAMKRIYQRRYEKPVEEHIKSDTSGDYQKLLLTVCHAARMEPPQQGQMMAMMLAQNDTRQADDLADKLYKAGEKRWGTDEGVFIDIMTKQSFPMLKAVFDSYQAVSGHDITSAIEKETSGNFKKALLAIVWVIRNPAAFFADRVHKSMKGAGTDDNLLIRVCVTRAEKDLKTVAKAYELISGGKKLFEQLDKEVSGDYRKGLVSLVQGNH